MNKNPKRQKGGFYIGPEMLYSPAFQSLTGSALRILCEIGGRSKKVEIKKRKKWNSEWVRKNDGEIILTYIEACKILGMTKATYRSGIDQLVNGGFIYIEHSGGGFNGHCSTYGLSDMWMEYGTDKFKIKKRPKDTRGNGFTRDNWEERTRRKRVNFDR